MTGIYIGGNPPSNILVAGQPVSKVLVAGEQVWPLGLDPVVAQITTSKTYSLNAQQSIGPWEAVQGPAEIITNNGPADSTILLSEDHIGKTVDITATVEVGPSRIAGNQKFYLLLGSSQKGAEVHNTSDQSVIVFSRQVEVPPPDFEGQAPGWSRGVQLGVFMSSFTSSQRVVRSAELVISVV